MDVNDNNPANGSNVLNSYIMNGAKFTDANGVPYVSLGSGNHTLFQNLLGWGLDIDGNFGGIGGVWLRSQSGILLLYNHQCFIMADNGVSSSKFSSTGTSYFQTRADSSSYIVSDPNDVYKGFRVDRYGTHLGQMNAGFPRTSAFDVMSSFQFFSGIPRMHASDRDAILKECVGTVTVTAGGTGYHNGDIISFGGGGNNSGNAASGTINVTSGVITGVNLSFSGFGYTGVPTSANVSGTGSGATFTYTMSYPVGAMAYILNDSAIDGTLGVIEIFNGSTWKKLW
jgi:hypothetical protein